MLRHSVILSKLEAARSVSAESLCSALGVGRRTLTNEISQLQELLGSSATIAVEDGWTRLVVADRPRYQALRAQVAGAPPSFNDANTRASYIIGRLFRSPFPIRIDELADEMSVGRTTLVADVARARQLLDGTELAIDGRPNVGLELVGPELQARLLVLKSHFVTAYANCFPDVRNACARLAEEVGLGEASIDELARWASVVVDRVGLGHGIGHLSQRYDRLRSSQAHAFAQRLVEELSAELGVALEGEESLFLSLPIAGSRSLGERVLAEPQGDGLGDELIAAVRSEMDIDLSGSRFLGEFSRHVAFLLNRLRYQLTLSGDGISDPQGRFPVAHRMAQVAASVIEQEVGLPLNDAELALFAAYFQVFLEERQPVQPEFRHAVIVTEASSVTGELLRLQLAKHLPGSAEISTQSPGTASPDVLDLADLVVVTDDHAVQTHTPVIRVANASDIRGLNKVLKRVHLRMPRGPGDEGASVLAGSLDETRFFRLPPGINYLDAVEFMCHQLEARGLVETGFRERIVDREHRSRMILDPWVALPHTTVYESNEALLAIGVIPYEPGELGPRLIVLLGVPEDAGLAEPVLLAIYDEVLRLGARHDLVEAVSRVTSYEEFYYFMENNPLTER